MTEKRIYLPSVPGASSMLVIFSVLALVVFSVLSVSAASAEQKMAEQTAASIEAYYAAECEAERILSEIRQGVLPEGVTEKEGIYSYSCPVSEIKTLSVSVTADGDGFRILQWQVVVDGSWQQGQNLDVWDGETILDEGGDGIWPI